VKNGRQNTMTAKKRDEPISDLPKTSRPAQQALHNIGVATLEQLSRFSEQEIAALHGMGPKALAILKVALAEKGLSFTER
jgi:DNA-directed RNA polymerase alpha subunit